jgi:hypothetical protein
MRYEVCRVTHDEDTGAWTMDFPNCNAVTAYSFSALIKQMEQFMFDDCADRWAMVPGEKPKRRPA